MLKSRRAATANSTIIDAYTAIDLDRTILKSTTLFYDYIIPELLHTYEFERTTIDQVRTQEISQRGLAFDFIDYLNTLATGLHREPISVDKLADSIINRHRDTFGAIRKEFIDSILVDGTLPLITELAGRPNEQWGIMTSGGQQTQMLKCQIVHTVVAELLTQPFLFQIIATEHKAQTIGDDWHNMTTQLFVLPSDVFSGGKVCARTVRLLDDKPQNLALSSDAKQRVGASLELYLVQTAERSEVDGISLVEVSNQIRCSKTIR